MGGKKKGPQLTPLFEACDTDDLDALQEILAKDKSQVKTLNSDGWTPLHQAAYAGAIDCVQELIKAGADVRAPCRQGDTPIHYAAAQSNHDVIKALAKAGSPLELKDKDGETPYDVAGSRATKKLITELVEAREARGQDTGRGRADGEEDDAEDWEEVDEGALAAEELEALRLADAEAAAQDAATGSKAVKAGRRK
ncbi:hypothetical protein HYH03_008253 [Edaphochlamys debaryana]|uniref:Ankyrin repeat protein n=1 Tax=Edaphochlamys debaryana TaxID=47281 RepID=A0A836BZJ0_9CHLO|nr:hypothetical protein HYH03_008253 [Edaphochlamys debaryana]|eukprot:KAG2493434.1 hypothetical protein HYH03_008253 [Edaphochlamys debaryana]